MQHKSLKLFLIAYMLMASDVFAGTAGTITYGPPVASVPALSNLMMVILGILLAVLAFRALRSYSGSQPLASLAVLAIAGLTMVPGVQLIKEAHAFAGYIMNNPAGGIVSVGSFGESPVANTSGAIQQIKSVAGVASCTSEPPAGSPACTPGATVPDTQFCYVKFTCPPL